MSARACSTGVACTPRVLVILLLSTMKGSSNWYCISEQLPQGAVGQCGYANHPGLDLAEPGARLPCLLEGKIDQLPGGVGVWVVGEMPHLAGRVGMLAEDGEAFADVGDVGVGVGLVGVAEDGGGLSGQGGGEEPVAEVGLGAAARVRSSPRRVRWRPQPDRPGGRRAARWPSGRVVCPSWCVRRSRGSRSVAGPPDGRTCRRSPC